jgi:plastocyanin
MRGSTGTMLAAVLVLALGACGSGGGGGGDTATCTPRGTSVPVEAKNFQFAPKCLAAPANTPFTIEFHNADGGTPHNVAIVSDSGDKVFTGAIFNGDKTEDYHVDSLPAGTYSFHCDVHSTMTGVFVVQ